MKFGKLTSNEGSKLSVERKVNSTEWQFCIESNLPYLMLTFNYEDIQELSNILNRSCGIQDTGILKPLEPVKLNIAEEAINIVHGDREQTYGSPTKNLDTIAQFWNGYINSKNKSDTSVLTGQDVSHLMMLLKIARLANSPDHRDSLVDTVGYALLSEICNGDKK